MSLHNPGPSFALYWTQLLHLLAAPRSATASLRSVPAKCIATLALRCTLA